MTVLCRKVRITSVILPGFPCWFDTVFSPELCSFYSFGVIFPSTFGESQHSIVLSYSNWSQTKDWGSQTLRTVTGCNKQQVAPAGRNETTCNWKDRAPTLGEGDVHFSLSATIFIIYTRVSSHLNYFYRHSSGLRQFNDFRVDRTNKI